jgi:hypothetical protein
MNEVTVDSRLMSDNYTAVDGRDCADPLASRA